MGLYGASEHTYWQSTCEVKTNLQRIGKIFAIIFLRLRRAEMIVTCVKQIHAPKRDGHTMCEMQRCVCNSVQMHHVCCVYIFAHCEFTVRICAMPVNYLCCAISSLSVLHQLLKSVGFGVKVAFM